MGRVTLLISVVLLALVAGFQAMDRDRAVAQKADEQGSSDWVAEMEEIFIRSEDCKQCHDRHYEEWKGIREQTPDLKTFGRVDAALLHGTALESPVFRTVLGLWLQTSPTPEQRRKCLSCHVPAVTIYPQYVDKITSQVMSGKVEIEGIGCASCHLINAVEEKPAPPPTFKLNPGKVIYGPYAEPEDNLVHPSSQSELYRGVNYCVSCHFDKVKDVTRRDLPGEILRGTICQDCHMEPSTGSSTSRRGALTRPIGRHWFRGIVIPGIMLRNRNLQAEWMPRVDIEVETSPTVLRGKVVVRTGSLPHNFPGGDPVLKQFFLTVTAKDEHGLVVASARTHFGLPFDKLIRGPIPDPLIKGGTTTRVPFELSVSKDQPPVAIEALLTYALIPEPEPELRERYLATLATEKERQAAIEVIEEYTQERMLTFRTKELSLSER